ncbi:MAG TPA: putative porin [Hanamia sp.]
MVISKKIINNVSVLAKKFVAFFIFVFCLHYTYGQLPGRLGNLQGMSGGQHSSRGDSITFEHRDDLKDSINISYHYLNSLIRERIDSSVNDFGKYYSVPDGYVNLGNNGNAAYPVLFTPFMQPGWDAGFHAFDVYKYDLNNTRFYNTTRPYTELGLLFGTGKEQLIKILQTQNINPGWNVTLEYRLISSPGLFQTKNTNHNNYRFSSNYQGKRKRYAAYFILQGNKLGSSENGGIQADSFLQDPARVKRFAVPVNLGNDTTNQNIFSNSIATGNRYNDFNFFLRQSYDLGKKDSIIINDSTTEYLFYPKLRFQYTVNYSSLSYQYRDTLSNPSAAAADSGFYKKHYDTTLNPTNGFNFSVVDKWKIISNDFVIRQFPETKNQGQYIEAGVRVENISGHFSSGTTNLYNIIAHGEYRNKTRNRKWDADLHGEFYAAGYDAGNFNVYASLARALSKKFGEAKLSFENTNRSPSYIYEGNSSFNFGNRLNTKNENITVLTATAVNPRFSLMARNISITNYAYFKNFYQTAQFGGLLNLTQITASTKTKIVGHFHLYSDFTVQQTAGNNPIHVPLFYTSQRLAFEGLYFKNLNLSTGLQVIYNTPYKADNYSPVMGKFFLQDSIKISNLPTINAFFNFRIKSFTAFIRIENLNTVTFSPTFQFTNNSFAAPLYPTPGFLFKFGIKWGFVN